MHRCVIPEYAHSLVSMVFQYPLNQSNGILLVEIALLQLAERLSVCTTDCHLGCTHFVVAAVDLLDVDRLVGM